MQNTLLLEAFRTHELELLRFLAKRLGSASQASDLAHDLYVKLLRIDDSPPVRDHRSYLFAMAANLATDHLRVEARRRQILAEAEDLIWRRAEDLTPERHAMARTELHFLKAEFAKLPLRCRRVFFLNRFRGQSQAEIAETLGIGLTTVYKDLKLALSTLVDARRRFRGIEAKDDKHEKA